jgi:AcrR family transcriptional regulator
MGRRSLARERTVQILRAYAVCIGRFGLEAATLERVSEESGFSRGHIRHYVGNRDDMRRKLVQWVVDNVRDSGVETCANVPQGQRARARMRHMLESGLGPAPDNAAIDVLLGASTYDSGLREMMRNVYLDVERSIADFLRDDFPGASAKVYRDGAYQLLAIAFGNWSLSELEFPASRQRSAVAIGEAVIQHVRESAENAQAAKSA